MDSNTAFDTAYWLSLPPEVRALKDVPDVGKSAELVQDLVQKGFTIDVPIQVWNWSPWKTMLLRESYGYTWVASAGQPPPLVAPRTDFPNDIGITRYDPDNPPAGSIRVSTNIADYPPFDPPAPPPPVTTGTYVGYDMGGGFFVSRAGDPAKDGDIVTEARGTFRFRQAPGGLVGGWYQRIA